MNDRFDRLFEDLEAAQRAKEAHERAGEFSDRVAEAYVDSELMARLAGAVGQSVEARVNGHTHVGELVEIGHDWILLGSVHGGGAQWLIRLSAVEYVVLHATGGTEQGLSLSFRSVLRRWAATRRAVRLETVAGTTFDVTIAGVGQDYVHARRPQGGLFVFPLTALAMVSGIDEG